MPSVGSSQRVALAVLRHRQHIVIDCLVIVLAIVLAIVVVAVLVIGGSVRLALSVSNRPSDSLCDGSTKGHRPSRSLAIGARNELRGLAGNAA